MVISILFLLISCEKLEDPVLDPTTSTNQTEVISSKKMEINPQPQTKKDMGEKQKEKEIRDTN